MSAPRYFALAHRLPAYSGVLAARVEAEREDHDQHDEQPAPARRTAEPRREAEQPQSVAALAARHPGEIELVKVV